jgi:hypothetical protein
LLLHPSQEEVRPSRCLLTTRGTVSSDQPFFCEMVKRQALIREMPITSIFLKEQCVCNACLCLRYNYTMEKSLLQAFWSAVICYPFPAFGQQYVFSLAVLAYPLYQDFRASASFSYEK